MNRLMATAAVSLGMVLATVAPASASECEATTQEARRTSGVWEGTAGSLVASTPTGSGLTWTTVDGASLEFVHMETAPSTVGGATISAAVTLPGAPVGTVPIAGADDVLVRFVGTPNCVVDGLGDAVLEVQAVEVSAPVAARVTTPAEAPSDPVGVAPRRAWGFGTHYAI